MPLFHIIVLAIVQGVTEFLPISSSGHLVLTWELFDAFGRGAAKVSEADRLDLDIAVHVGTLLAVCLYFRRDLGQMLHGMLKLATGRRDAGTRMALCVLLGTLPIVLAGYFARDAVSEVLRSLSVVAWCNIVFALFLWVADRFSLRVRDVEHMSLLQALVIGLAQVLALLPGTSRSGVTMTAARFFGLRRAEAARFSMLLAIPAIAGAGTLAGLDLYRSGDLQLGTDALLAAAFALATALVTIAALMRWLRRASFGPFVAYRLVMGGALLWLVYG